MNALFSLHWYARNVLAPDGVCADVYQTTVKDNRTGKILWQGSSQELYLTQLPDFGWSVVSTQISNDELLIDVEGGYEYKRYSA